jgi:hypothetical protein
MPEYQHAANQIIRIAGNNITVIFLLITACPVERILHGVIKSEGFLILWVADILPADLLIH